MKFLLRIVVLLVLAGVCIGCQKNPEKSASSYLLSEGIGFVPSDSQERELFKGCINGNPVACSEAAKHVGSDKQKAWLFYMGRACDLGDASKCFGLGGVYFTDVMHVKDDIKARHYFEMSCRDGAGELLGCEYLWRVLARQKNLKEEELKKGVGLLKIACDKGRGSSCYIFGQIAKQMNVCSEKVNIWMEKGCKLGDEDACKEYKPKIPWKISIQDNGLGGEFAELRDVKIGKESISFDLKSTFSNGMLHAACFEVSPAWKTRTSKPGRFWPKEVIVPNGSTRHVEFEYAYGKALPEDTEEVTINVRQFVSCR